MNLPKVTIDKLAEESGYTVAALRCKIQRGEFAQGIHFIKSPDGRIHFIVSEYLKWVESNSTEKVSKSRSAGTVSGTGLPSKSRQQHQI
jgi:hypothetical protein